MYIIETVVCMKDTYIAKMLSSAVLSLHNMKIGAGHTDRSQDMMDWTIVVILRRTSSITVVF